MDGPVSFAAVLFDWNGTLMDDVRRAQQATDTVLTHFGLRVLGSEDRLRATFVLPLSAWFRDLGVAPTNVEEAVAQWNREMAARSAVLRHGAMETLHALRARGLHLGVVSAASRDAVAADVERAGLTGVLHSLDGDAEPKRIAIARRMSTIGPHAALYVGDTEYDMLEATAAGATPVGIAGGYRPVDALVAAGARFIAARLDDLIPYAGR